VAKSKYLGTTVKYRNSIHEEVKDRLNSGMLAAIVFRVFCLPTSPLKTFKIKSYKTIILSVVFYRCDIWSLTLGEEHRLRGYENRVLMRIFGPKREEVAGGWKRLHNVELHNLYASPNIIRVIISRSMS
jgi:hypothetical protein